MSSRFLQVFIDNASYAVADMMPLVKAHALDLHGMLDFCTQYRRRGIAHLLKSGRADLLWQDLQRSGSAFAAYLERADDSRKIASKASPFFDAVASGDVQTANKIAQSSATAWVPDEEYEDDFLYIRILMSRFCLNAGQDVLGDMLNRYEVLLDGANDPRFVICQAYMEGRPKRFDAALEDLIAVRAEDYASGIEAEDVVEEDWATEGNIFIEGMALVRFAGSLGFQVQKEYLFIPSTVMTPGSMKCDGASWMSP
jgi:hypothetical protein